MLGIEALPVEIETNIVLGVPGYTVVGLPGGAVRESLDRIFASVRNRPALGRASSTLHAFSLGRGLVNTYCLKSYITPEKLTVHKSR